MAFSCSYNDMTIEELETAIYWEHKKALSESDQYLIDHLNQILSTKKV